MSSSKTIVFVTGAFVSHLGWQEWQRFFEDKGYATLAPAWPGKDASPAVLRKRHPDPVLAGVTLDHVIESYASVIRSLPEKPILIGHSFGGLMVQILVNRGLAAAGIAYHSVPPQGVLSFEFSFIKSLWGPLGIFSKPKTTFLMSFPQWQYAFSNGMPLEEQQHYYEQLVIPESRPAMRAALSKTAKIDFKKPHAPLLLIAGSEDHIMPASLNLKNFKRYKQNGSVTQYKEFEGRNHLAMAQPMWKEDAHYILNWLKDVL